MPHHGDTEEIQIGTEERFEARSSGFARAMEGEAHGHEKVPGIFLSSCIFLSAGTAVLSCLTFFLLECWQPEGNRWP